MAYDKNANKYQNLQFNYKESYTSFMFLMNSSVITDFWYSGYISFDITRAAGADIMLAPSRCSADIYTKYQAYFKIL